jgi:hypothetical protein
MLAIHAYRVAWTGLRNPTILWTYSLASDINVLNSFFQQHLLMNVYPMVRKRLFAPSSAYETHRHLPRQARDKHNKR